MGSIWTIASILCLIVAALLLLRENYDAAFVAAALGAVAWFLNYRSKIRETIPKEPETTLDDEEDSDNEDEEQ
jgi:uncharacterized membrane protein YhfC